ncbi:MAG: hypothetical protein L6Q76_32660 [Polyangiaceae bacterium]|nr:hypothetical protein [Polyangiaceae bacterium]
MVPAPWKFSVLSVVFASTFALSVRPASAEERAPTTLPLRAARLYEIGLGYFERTGKLGKASDLSLPVPASHLDDALKTLVVLGDGGKTSVAGIEFASHVSTSMGRALAGLPEDDGTITYSKLLKTLQGASVELKTERETIRGRLVDITPPGETEEAECAASDPKTAANGAKPAAPCVMVRPMTLLLLTERGEIRRLRSADVTSVRPLEPGFAARIGSGLDANSTQGTSIQKKLRVLATSSSDITLGYVAEAPVWRSSYRLVMDDNAGGALQGWALIHNDTDEDWKQVKVELVNVGKCDRRLVRRGRARALRSRRGRRGTRRGNRARRNRHDRARRRLGIDAGEHGALGGKPRRHRARNRRGVGRPISLCPALPH